MEVEILVHHYYVTKTGTGFTHGASSSPQSKPMWFFLLLFSLNHRRKQGLRGTE